MICSPWRYQLTAAVWPPFPGVTSCPLILRKGAAHEYIRSSSTLPCHHRYLQPVHSGKKEVTAQPPSKRLLLNQVGANRLPVAPLSIFIIAISFVMSSFALHRAVPRRVAGNCSFYTDLLALIGRNVTICARVQPSAGLNGVADVPLVTAHATQHQRRRNQPPHR